MDIDKEIYPNPRCDSYNTFCKDVYRVIIDNVNNDIFAIVHINIMSNVNNGISHNVRDSIGD
jgi:hypothetical protein